MGKKTLAVFMLFIMLFSGCSSPEKTEVITDGAKIIAPGSIGGGWDITARAMQMILTSENLVEQDVGVLNIVGAGGESGWKYTKKQKGQVLTLNSSLLITNQLLGRSRLSYKDFTPIAILATEWEVLIVSKDSNINSAKMLMEKLRETPEAYEVGVSPSLGNDDQLSFVIASEQAGIRPEELDFLLYENSAQVVDALGKQQIDLATMTLAEARNYYDAGQIKILAISSDKRLEGLSDVPTWTEQGIDVVFEHWRGVMGPPDMSKEEIRYWDETIGKMVETEEWKRTLQKYQWNDLYMNSSETSAFLETQKEMYRTLLRVEGRKD